MPKKIKICVIGCRFNHPLGERCMRMWRHLARKYPVEVHILTTNRWIDAPGDSRLPNSKNLKVHKLFTLFAKHGQFKHTMPSLIENIMAINPDIVYAQEEALAIGVTFPAYLAAKAINKPFVFYTFANIVEHWPFPIEQLEKQVIRNADIELAVTEDSKQFLIKKGANQKKIVVLPETGMDSEIFKPRKKKFTKTLLYIGRFVPEKGINLILKAREILLKKGKKYNYLFVGKGPLKEKLESLARKNKDVIVRPPVPYEKIQGVYGKGDVLLYPSLKTKKWIEQYGYSMLEALSSGLPVISSKVSGPKAIIKDGYNGHLIEVGDYKALAKKTEALMENKSLLRKFSSNARYDAVHRLSNEAVAKKTYEVLKCLKSSS